MNRIYGRNPIVEALKAELSISKIWLLRGPGENQTKARFHDIEHEARKRKIPIHIVNDRVQLLKLLDEPSQKSVSIIAELSQTNLYDESFLYSSGISKVLIPVNVEDPHNLGAVIRTSKAFGFGAVVITSRRSSPVTETVINSSAGAALSLPIVRIVNVVNCLEKLKKLGFWVYGTDVSSQGSQNYIDVDYDPKMVLLVGNEAKGLSEHIKKHCDFRIHIPCEFDSLNVSVATGIILSQIYNKV